VCVVVAACSDSPASPTAPADAHVDAKIFHDVYPYRDAAPCGYDANEPNDALATATSLGIVGSQTADPQMVGSMCPGDLDYFVVTTTADQAFTVFEMYSLLKVYFVDASDNDLAGPSNIPDTFPITHMSKPAGTYYVKIEPYAGEMAVSTPYMFDLVISDPDPP
jgi:hypothetical protein